ncbi:MAG: c-type cytochrome [Acidobacteria bacterium]|nr:c-type cytochrome [Acidobacteriota bacterium]
MSWLPVLLLVTPTFAAEPPAQAARGKAIFVDAATKTSCYNCHELNKEGTAVGPDLSKIARLSPRALKMSIMATRTVYAKEVELKTKKAFPAMVASESASEVKVHDLSTVPPTAMTIDRKEIYSIRDNATWKHPPENVGFSNQQLADVIAYIRFASFGDTKGVSVEEMQ